MKKKTQKKAPEQLDHDSDEHFAYIAGYTEGGVPYGVTWEETEEIEHSATAPRTSTPPPQNGPVSLNEIAQEMQTISDTMTVYFKRSTGEFIMVTDDYMYAAEDDESLDNRPEWEQEAIRQTAEVLADEIDDYVPLPSRYDIHEYAIMENFCHSVAKPKIADDLCRSISGRGAFRRFKAAIRRHGIENDWYRFKDEAYKEIALEWCEDNGIIRQE